jgi:tRNA U55 pseudouridine synthase TruB
LNAKTVRIDEIKVLDYCWPRLELEITCGSGTYIRSIARDLGLQLGCGALMSRLERTRVGNFSVTESLPDDEITVATIQERIRPAVEIVAGLPAFDCSADDVGHLICGRMVRLDRSKMRNTNVARDVIAGDIIAHFIAVELIMTKFVAFFCVIVEVKSINESYESVTGKNILAAMRKFVTRSKAELDNWK